jgi:hypothetical protein
VLRMQAMQQTTARELFRDRVLLDKLCNNPQDFLLDIRQVAAPWTVLFGTCTPDCVAIGRPVAARNPGGFVHDNPGLMVTVPHDRLPSVQRTRSPVRSTTRCSLLCTTRWRCPESWATAATVSAPAGMLARLQRHRR